MLCRARRKISDSRTMTRRRERAPMVRRKTL
jgi:hypothetical protein